MFYLSASTHLARADEFNLKVSDDGAFKIYVGDTAWFKSGPAWFAMNGKVYLTADHSLKLRKTEKLTDLTDNLGVFNSQVVLDQTHHQSHIHRNNFICSSFQPPPFCPFRYSNMKQLETDFRPS